MTVRTAPAPQVVSPDAIYSSDQVALVLGIDRSSARRLFRREAAVLRPATIGKRRYVRGSDLLALLDARRVAS